MSVSHGASRLRRLHSKTKASKHGLSQYISGRSASFQSLQLVLEGELGDSTSVLSKEWQALTPRANSCTSGGSGATLQHACLDGLLDGIAELSTCCGDADGSVHSGASIGGGSMPGFAGGSPAAGSTGGSPFGVRLKPCDSPPRACSRQTTGLQVVPVAYDAAASPPSPWAARSYDSGRDAFSRRVPAMRSDSLDSSCGGSAGSNLSVPH